MPLPTEMKSGIYDIPENDYHKGPGISQTSLKPIEQSMAHYQYEKANPIVPTPDMNFGSLYHTVCFQPELLDQVIAYGPDSARRKAADKEAWAVFWAENANKIKVNAEGYVLGLDKYGKIAKSEFSIGTAKEMKMALEAHPIASNALYCEGAVEQSMYSVDEETGLLKRGRIDKVPSSGNTLIDLKTIVSVSDHGIAKACAERYYYVQGAYYLDIANELGLEREIFVFVFQEKKKPYHVRVMQLSQSDIEYGRHKYRIWMDKLFHSISNDTWPGYADEIGEIEMPKYAY